MPGRYSQGIQLSQSGGPGIYSPANGERLELSSGEPVAVIPHIPGLRDDLRGPSGVGTWSKAARGDVLQSMVASGGGRWPVVGGVLVKDKGNEVIAEPSPGHTTRLNAGTPGTALWSEHRPKH